LEGIKLVRLSQALISLLQITNTDYALGGRESGEWGGVVMLGRGEVELQGKVIYINRK